jgi:putative adhesin
MNRYLLAAVLTGLAFSASTTHADDWSKTYPISKRADLQVQTDDGSVSVVTGNQNQIVAKVTTEGYKIGPNDVRIEESQTGDRVTLSVKTPHMNWSGHRSLHVTVTVPRDLDLELSTGDGGVDLQPVGGRIHVRTGDGSIRADGLHGDVSLHTGDGGIDAHNLDGTLVADSGDGSIHIGGRFDGLSINTGDGGVDADAAAGSKMTSAWTLHSGDGSISLSVPQDLKAYVDLKTGDGSIKVDMPLTIEGTVDHSHVHGNLNGGGSELKITSGDGPIHLMKS